MGDSGFPAPGVPGNPTLPAANTNMNSANPTTFFDVFAPPADGTGGGGGKASRDPDHMNEVGRQNRGQ